MRKKVWFLAFTFVFLFWAVINVGLVIDLEKRFYGVRKEAQIVSKSAPQIYVMGFQETNDPLPMFVPNTKRHI